jgi:hypothetical protein
MLARSEFGMSYLQAPSSHEGENILYQRHSLRPVRLKSFTRWEARKPLQAISVFSIHVALYLIPVAQRPKHGSPRQKRMLRVSHHINHIM